MIAALRVPIFSSIWTKMSLSSHQRQKYLN
jgi:hypothetical protein